jgi:hypothetical protein
VGLTPALTRERLPALIPNVRNAHDAYLPLQDLNTESRRVLTAEDMQTIKRIAGDTIVRVGYPADAADGAGPVNRLSG